jgi:hypothetical protein
MVEGGTGFPDLFIIHALAYVTSADVSKFALTLTTDHRANSLAQVVAEVA